MALISVLAFHSALIGIHISTGFLAGYVLCRKYRALTLRDRWQHYKLTTSFLTLLIFCAVFIVLNSLLWNEATLKEAAVVWFSTAFLFLIGACVGFIHGGVVVACGNVNTKTSKALRLNKLRQPKSRGKKRGLGRDEEKIGGGSSEDEVTPQEVQKGKQVSGREFKKPTSVLQQQRKYTTDKSTRNTTDRQSSLQDTQTRHKPKRKGKTDLTETGDDDTLAEGYSSGYKSESSEDPEENMIPAYGSGNTRTEFRHSPRSPYITAGFSNENRITDRGTKSKTKKKKKNDTIAIDDKVAKVLSSVNKSGSSEHSEELEHSTGASYVASASCQRGPRTKRDQIKGKEPPHLSSPRKPKTDNKWKKLPAKESQNQLIHSPHESLGQYGSTSLLTPEEQNQRNEEEEEAIRDNIGRKNDDVVKQQDISSSGRTETSIETPKPVELRRMREIQHQMNQLKARTAEEEARRLAEEEARRLAEEEAARRLAEEEAARRLAEEEAARRLAEEEARWLAEEEARRLTEEEAARRLAEEEARRLAEEEARRIAEEEAARRLAEEEARRLAEEEARRLAEEEARRLAEEEARRLAEEEARRLAEEEARRFAEEEARRLAEEEARRLAEEEAARQLAEEEARRIAEEEAKQLAEERARHLAAEEAARWLAEQQAARRLADERAAKLVEERAAKLVEERAAKLAQEKAAKLAEEEAAKLAEERAAKLVEEKAAKLAEEKAAKLAEE